MLNGECREEYVFVQLIIIWTPTSTNTVNGFVCFWLGVEYVCGWWLV